MKIPETVTHRSRNGEQTYVLVAVKPHERADGSKTQFAVWRTCCRLCGQAFCTTSGTSKRAIAKGMTVHCPEHRTRRPGGAP
jgi:hypothetical protein